MGPYEYKSTEGSMYDVSEAQATRLRNDTWIWISERHGLRAKP